MDAAKKFKNGSSTARNTNVSIETWRDEEKQMIQFYNIYQILYGWFQKCSTANIYLEGPMLKE